MIYFLSYIIALLACIVFFFSFFSKSIKEINYIHNFEPTKHVQNVKSEEIEDYWEDMLPNDDFNKVIYLTRNEKEIASHIKNNIQQM